MNTDPTVDEDEPAAAPAILGNVLSRAGAIATLAGSANNAASLAYDSDRAADGQAFLSDFGTSGAVWFAEGKSYEEAGRLYLAELKSGNTALAAKVAQLEAKLSRGETIPAGFGGVRTDDGDKVKSAEAKLGSEGLARFAASITMPDESPGDRR